MIRSTENYIKVMEEIDEIVKEEIAKGSEGNTYLQQFPATTSPSGTTPRSHELLAMQDEFDQYASDFVDDYPLDEEEYGRISKILDDMGF